MLIEIIMIVHNQIKYTEAALNSLYRCTDPREFKLILVDSGSDDTTKNFLKEYKKSAPNMEIIVLPSNEGWCKGINAGYRHLTRDSNFILWSNNDVLYEKNWLPKMIAHFKGGVGAVGPSSSYVVGRQKAIYNYNLIEEEAPFLIGFCLMFRREVIDLVGDIDERFGIGGAEEMDYILRMKKELGFKCMIARDVYVHHFGSKTLLPYVGNSYEEYNNFCIEKDTLLKEKWGEEVVNQFLSYPLNDILMCVPRKENVTGKFWKDTLTMLKPPTFQVVDFERVTDVSYMRNELVNFALEGNFRRLLFVDSDMEIPQDAIFRLMQIQAPIKAGYFFAREHPHQPCASRFNGNGALMSVFFPNTGVQEVDGVGMAFTMIDMDVFRKLKKPYFYFDHSPNGMGEDMGFCYKVRKELGLKIFVDTDLIIRHTGKGTSIGPEQYLEVKTKLNENSVY